MMLQCNLLVWCRSGPLCFLLLIQSFLSGQSQYIHNSLCKGDRNCACMAADNGLVDCNSKDRILGIPSNLDSSAYRNLVIQSVKFPTPAILKRANITSLYRLLRLKVVSCGLQKVESKAFVDLQSLMELDLSLNELTTIESDTFLNLKLDFLRLDHNRHLELGEHSFRGLKAKQLSLRNCGLKTISYATLFHADFNTVDLFNNQIDRLDPKIAEIVRDSRNGRKMLDLTKNPLRCSCDMLWLADLIRDNTQASPTLSKVDISMTCTYYKTMHNYSLALLRSEDLNCNKSFIEEVMIDFTGMSVSNDGNIQNTRIACSAVSSSTPNVSLGYFDNEKRQEISHINKARDATSSEQRSLVEASVTLTKKPKTYYCHVKDSSGGSKNEQEVKLLISMDIDTLLDVTNGLSYQPSASPPPNSDLRFSALHLIYAVLITFLFTFLTTFIIWRIYKYWCHGCVPCHYSFKPPTCSSSQDSAYSMVKAPVSSSAMGAGFVPINGNSNMDAPVLPQYINNNNHLPFHKPLLSPTGSDYDIPQQVSAGNLAMYPPQLLGSSSVISGPPIMGVSARKGNGNTLTPYPHSRTLSTLRLGSPASNSGSPNTSVIFSGPIPNGMPTLSQQQQHHTNASFIDFRTGQLCTPTSQLMSTSLSQPHALHSSLGYLS